MRLSNTNVDDNQVFWRRSSTAVAIFGAGLLILSTSIFLRSHAQVHSRGLAIRHLSGNVTLHQNGSRSASRGDRLEAAGHGVNTGGRSSTVLAIDDGIGTVTVAENTRLAVVRLDTLSNGGSVTILDVPRGQARIRARSFTNPSSRLELHTPSGVAAVRGTEFGISVSETGKMSVGTLEGTVAASAQGELVEVEAGLASVIEPGEPPTTPMRLDRVLAFDLIALYAESNGLFIEGRIHPSNSLFIEGQEVSVDVTGGVMTTIPLTTAGPITLIVRNPLGESKEYRLAL